MENILVAASGTPAGQEALETAARLASDHRARLTIFARERERPWWWHLAWITEAEDAAWCEAQHPLPAQLQRLLRSLPLDVEVEIVTTRGPAKKALRRHLRRFGGEPIALSASPRSRIHVRSADDRTPSDAAAAGAAG